MQALISSAIILMMIAQYECAPRFHSSRFNLDESPDSTPHISPRKISFHADVHGEITDNIFNDKTPDMGFFPEEQLLLRGEPVLASPRRQQQIRQFESPDQVLVKIPSL